MECVYVSIMKRVLVVCKGRHCFSEPTFLTAFFLNLFCILKPFCTLISCLFLTALNKVTHIRNSLAFCMLEYYANILLQVRLKLSLYFAVSIWDRF